MRPRRRIETEWTQYRLPIGITVGAAFDRYRSGLDPLIVDVYQDRLESELGVEAFARSVGLSVDAVRDIVHKCYHQLCALSGMLESVRQERIKKEREARERQLKRERETREEKARRKRKRDAALERARRRREIERENLAWLKGLGHSRAVGHGSDGIASCSEVLLTPSQLRQLCEEWDARSLTS